MRRQTLIQERVISVQEFCQRAVLAHNAIEKELRFLRESLAQIVVEIGVDVTDRREAVQVA